MALFSRKSAPAMFSADRLGFAVGDIHGRADLLARMLERLEQAAAKAANAPIVVFLGDYIDRGPDSAEVIDLLLTGRPEGFERHFLKGNHEAAMLAFLDDPIANKAWLEHGGLETVASYQVHPLPSRGAGGEQLMRARDDLAKRLPPEHLAFLAGLERYVPIGDYVFAHAGVDPKRKLEEQTDADLLWIRGRFLDDQRRLPFRVVHGHTPVAAPYEDERRVAVDTGAYYSGVLTAARFQGDSVDFLSVSPQTAFSRF
jgi:serine/threonine protein phosphatase 1